jgi:glutaredoxin-related protein
MCALVQLDLMPEGPAIQEYLTLLTGKPTVPYVFINGQFIGGSEVRSPCTLSLHLCRHCCSAQTSRVAGDFTHLGSSFCRV